VNYFRIFSFGIFPFMTAKLPGKWKKNRNYELCKENAGRAKKKNKEIFFK